MLTLVLVFSVLMTLIASMHFEYINDVTVTIKLLYRAMSRNWENSYKAVNAELVHGIKNIFDNVTECYLNLHHFVSLTH